MRGHEGAGPDAVLPVTAGGQADLAPDVVFFLQRFEPRRIFGGLAQEQREPWSAQREMQHSPGCRCAWRRGLNRSARCAASARSTFMNGAPPKTLSHEPAGSPLQLAPRQQEPALDHENSGPGNNKAPLAAAAGGYRPERATRSALRSLSVAKIYSPCPWSCTAARPAGRRSARRSNRLPRRWAQPAIQTRLAWSGSASIRSRSASRSSMNSSGSRKNRVTEISRSRGRAPAPPATRCGSNRHIISRQPALRGHTPRDTRRRRVVSL